MEFICSLTAEALAESSKSLSAPLANNSACKATSSSYLRCKSSTCCFALWYSVHLCFASASDDRPPYDHFGLSFSPVPQPVGGQTCSHGGVIPLGSSLVSSTLRITWSSLGSTSQPSGAGCPASHVAGVGSSGAGVDNAGVVITSCSL